MNLDQRGPDSEPALPEVSEGTRAPSPSWLDMLEQLPDGVMRIDSDGRLRYANPAAVRMLRLDAEDLAGGMFGYPLLEGEVQEISVHTRRGQRQRAELHILSIAWGEGRSWLALLRAKHGQTPQSDPHASVNPLSHAIVQNAPLAILALDTELKVTLWNRAAIEMLGWEDFEVLGRPPPPGRGCRAIPGGPRPGCARWSGHARPRAERSRPARWSAHRRAGVVDPAAQS